MKKEIRILIVIIILIISIIGVVIYNSIFNETMLKCITKNTWTRYSRFEERIGFTEDGNYYYYYTFGEPVESSDLYDKYKFNKVNNQIKLYSLNNHKNMTIKVISCDDKTLKLKFGIRIKTFTSKEYDKKN